MTTRHPQERSQIQLASGVNLLAGIWLALAPLFLAYGSQAAITSSIVVGSIIAIFALLRLLGGYDLAWMSWMNVVLGLWVIIAPFYFGLAGSPGRFWNSIIVGLLVAALGTWSALATRRMLHHGGTRM